MVKATEGNSHTEEQFKAQWAAAKACGLPRGAYHFWRFSQDADSQAKSFLAVVGQEPGELWPAIDVETSDNTGHLPGDAAGCKAARDSLVDAAKQVKAGVGKAPLLYSTSSFVSKHLCGDLEGQAACGAALADFGEWPAEWSTELDAPKLHGAWESGSLWQWQQNGNLDGDQPTVFDDEGAVTSGEAVDVDVFNGDEAALKAFAGM